MLPGGKVDEARGQILKRASEWRWAKMQGRLNSEAFFLFLQTSRPRNGLGRVAPSGRFLTRPTLARRDAPFTRRTQRSSDSLSCFHSSGGVRLASTCEASHPPSPGATRRAVCPDEHRLIIDPFQARWLSSGRGWIDLQLRAFDEHRLLKIRLVGCARWASNGDQPAHTPPPFPVCRVPRAQEADGPALPLSYTGLGARTFPTF